MDKSFILYTDIGPSILELKDAEVGRLTKAIYRYVMTGELTELKGSVKICFNMIRSHLDRDKAKYLEICQKRAEAGRKGGLSSGKSRKEANAEDRSATEAENENENENKNKNLYENINDNENKNGNAFSHPEPSVLQAKYPNAFLSRQDILTLMKEFPKDYEERIARLNRFIIDNDFPCEDPVNTIRIWATQEACREKGQRDRNKDWGRLGM